MLKYKLCGLLILMSLSVNIYAKPYIGGSFEDEIGKYDSPAIKVIIDAASKTCRKMFKGDFIIEHWLYKPTEDEVYLTGRTSSWFSFKEADCSYRPSNKSAAGSKSPGGLNIMGEYEKFKTENWSN